MPGAYHQRFFISGCAREPGQFLAVRSSRGGGLFLFCSSSWEGKLSQQDFFPHVIPHSSEPRKNSHPLPAAPSFGETNQFHSNGLGFSQ